MGEQKNLDSQRVIKTPTLNKDLQSTVPSVAGT